MSAPPRALHALLDGLIDYAGLFPPAALRMPDAVAAYDRYRQGADAWALGRFVVPAARLSEFAEAAAPLLAGAPWKLSVLATAADAPALDAFDAAYTGRAVIDCVEGKAVTAAEIEALAPLGDTGRQLFVEIPLGEATARLVPALAAARCRAKIRTGGVTADAFPAAADVARFLHACAAAGVPCKATAGLHHPIRGEYRLTYASDSALGTMYGFLNVMCAALLVGEGMPEAETIALLEERDAAAFSIDAHGIRWRHWFIPAERIGRGRAVGAASFGSCSFEEPLSDLRALALL